MDEDYGKLLYEYSDARHPLDMSKHERRRHIKSFTAVWILLCVLLITAWCIVDCVLDAQLYGSAAAESYVILFVILGVIILIAVLSVFGLWGVFMRKIGKFYRPHEPESRRRLEELQSELSAVDENKSRENAITVFEDRIVVKIAGVERIIRQSELSACSMIKSRAGVFLVLYVGAERIPLNCMLPVADAYMIKKCFGDKLEKVKPPKTKKSKSAYSRTEKSRRDKAEKHGREPIREQIEVGALVVGVICIIVGIGVVLLGYYHVMGDMPAVVGGFPISIGVMFLVLAFYKYEFVGAFLVKFVAAALLIFMGILFLFIIEEGVTKAPVTVSSLLRHPTVYGIACLFFVSVGISIIPKSIQSLAEYIKYR